jgi:hypothetical protein
MIKSCMGEDNERDELVSRRGRCSPKFRIWCSINNELIYPVVERV